MTTSDSPGVDPYSVSRVLQVSLVVPVRDEEATLVGLVGSIRAQTVLPAEVLLVDGGSSDRTPELARAVEEEDTRFRYIEAGPATPGRGRNVGIRAARNEWVALTDAGIRLEPNWLDELTRPVLEGASLDVVYGNYEPVEDSFFTQCAALAYTPAKRARPGGGISRGPSVATMLLRRSVWEAVGGFPDGRAAEDLVFMERLERSGARIGWATRATVHWQLRPDLGSTFRKFALYSKHNVWAGRQYDWHYGVLRFYLLAAPFVGLALFHHPAWLLVPVLGGLARVVKMIWRRAESNRWTTLLDPGRVGLVALILLTIDLATFVGWAQAKWERPPTTVPEAS
jgi:glycosyltransferase involved in cell wall biosynthesis